MERELEMLSRLMEQPGAAVRGRAGRREGVRQDQGHRPPAHEDRRPRPRRRHGEHLPPGAGPECRQEPRGARPRRGRPANPRVGREEGRPGRASRGRDRRQGDHPRHRVQDTAGREDPGQLAHRRRRQEVDRPHGRGARTRPDRVLERSARRLRDPRVRRRDARHGPAAGGEGRRRRNGGGRRRRLGRGRTAAGPGLAA